MTATATSPLTAIKDGVVYKLSRRFLGNLFPQNTMEKNELNSYIKGCTVFTFGIQLTRYDDGKIGIYPKKHLVRQEYFYKQITK